MFELVWLQCLGFKCIYLLTFKDLLTLTKAYPVVCDSLFHGSTLSKLFMRRYWRKLALHKHDFIQSHDCYELMYKQFIQFSHAPSTALLPLPIEGFYPVEPYLAWRITSLLKRQMELMFHWTPQIAEILEFDISFQTLAFVTIVSEEDGVYSYVAYNELEGSESQLLSRSDVLALVFEIVMMNWYDVKIFGTDSICEILQPLPKHQIMYHPGESENEAPGFLNITNQ